MQSKPKSNSVVTTSYDEAARKWSWTVADVGTLTLARDALHAAILERGLIEGISDRVVDRAAIPRDTKTGHSATPQEKFAAMQSLVERLESGAEEWSLRGDGTGGQVALAVEAFARANSCTNAEAKSRIEARAKDAGRTYLKQLAVVAQVFPEEYAAVVAERKALITPAFDAEAELAAFGA